MRVKLANAGGVADPFLIGRGDPRRLREEPPEGGGEGSGEEDKPDDDTDEEEKDEEEKDDEPNPDLQKAIQRRDRALKRAQKAEARIVELEKKLEEGDKPAEEDPVAKAQARLVRAEAKTQLAALGVTDRDDQKSVLDMLRLDGIDVDDDGDVDSDEIEERIAELARIFGGKAKTRKRVPASTTARDKSENSDNNSDPDKARYARIMRGR